MEIQHLSNFIDAAMREWLSKDEESAARWHSFLGKKIVQVKQQELNEDEYISEWMFKKYREDAE